MAPTTSSASPIF